MHELEYDAIILEMAFSALTTLDLDNMLLYNTEQDNVIVNCQARTSQKPRFEADTGFNQMSIPGHTVMLSDPQTLYELGHYV